MVNLDGLEAQEVAHFIIIRQKGEEPQENEGLKEGRETSLTVLREQMQVMAVLVIVMKVMTVTETAVYLTSKGSNLATPVLNQIPDPDFSRVCFKKLPKFGKLF